MSVEQTESANFEEAFNPPRDEQGRFAPAQSEPEQPAAAEQEGEVTTQQEQPKEPEHRIPLAEYLSEREKRQEYERQLAEYRRREAEAAKPQRERPDLITDPDAFTDFIREDARSIAEQIRIEVRNMRVDQTFEDQEEANPEKFRAAFSDFKVHVGDRNRVIDPQTYQRILTAPNPGKALMRWHAEQSTIREIGGDIAGYRKKLMADPAFQKEYRDYLESQARSTDNSGRSSNVTSLPSLNRMTGAKSAGGEGTDSFHEIFPAKPTKRK